MIWLLIAIIVLLIVAIIMLYAAVGELARVRHDLNDIGLHVVKLRYPEQQ